MADHHGHHAQAHVTSMAKRVRDQRKQRQAHADALAARRAELDREIAGETGGADTVDQR